MFDHDSDHQLIQRLHRIAVSVGSLADTGDRRRLAVAKSELETVRDAIVARCDKVTNDMRAHRMQRGAIAAYSRCAGLARGKSNRPADGKTTGT